MDVRPGLTKRCSQCCQELPVSEFYRASRSTDGRQPWCRICKRKYALQDVSEGRERGSFSAPVPPLRWFGLVCLACARDRYTKWTARRGLLERIASRLRCGGCGGFVLIDDAGAA